MTRVPYYKENEVKLYLKRLAEIAVAGFFTSGASYVATEGVDLSQAGLTGLLTAIGLGVYGVVVKHLGDDIDRPTVK